MTFTQSLGADDTTAAWMGLFRDTPNIAGWREWMGAGLLLLPTPRNETHLRRERTARALLANPKSVNGKISANLASRKERERVAARRKDRRDARLVRGSAISNTVPLPSGPSALNAADHIHEASARAIGGKAGTRRETVRPAPVAVASEYPRSRSGGYRHLDVADGAWGPVRRGEVEAHHVDGDPANYERRNIVRMAHSPHGALHGRVVPERATRRDAREVHEGKVQALLTSNDPAVMRAWTRLFGLEDDGCWQWRCPLSNAPDALASLTFNTHDELVYHRSYADSLPFLTMGEAYRAMVTGKRDEEVTRIAESGTGPSYGIWLTRAAAAAGLIELPPPPLPEPTIPAPSPTVHAAFPKLQLLFQCHAYVLPNAPVPATVTFVADWCGITRWRAASLLNWTRDGHAMVDAGRGGTGGRGYTLWLPRTKANDEREKPMLIATDTATVAITAVKRSERRSMARFLVRRGFVIAITGSVTEAFDMRRDDTVLAIERGGVISIVGPDAQKVAALINEAREMEAHLSEDEMTDGFAYGPLARAATK